MFLAYHKDYQLFLDELRELGLIHVAESQKTVEEDDEMFRLLGQVKSLRAAKATLQKIIDKKEEIKYNAPDVELGKIMPIKIEAIESDRALLVQQLQVSIKERDSLAPWGDFDPEAIKKLENAGWLVNFFVVPDNQFNPEWVKLHDAVVVNKETSKTYFVTVGKNANIANELNIESEKLPNISLSKLKDLIVSLKEKIAQQDIILKELVDDMPSIDLAIDECEYNITYNKVLQSTTSLAEDKIMLLQGWAPEDNEKEITDYLASKAVYYSVSDPNPEDDVPIKFKNNRFFRIFEPLTELYMLPKYNEIDLTPYFAPFYMVFFGLSLGDIGYGLFLLLVGLIAKTVMKDKLNSYMKAVLSLVAVLGASTMVSGLLTGGFFGFDIYQLPFQFAKDLKHKVFFDNNDMFLLSLKLGVVQILFGMIMKVANRTKQLGFKYAMSTIGWFVFLVSIIVSVMFPSVMPMFGTLHLIIIAPMLLLILFYNTPGKNPLYNFGLALWDTYNMATGLLGDILSYVRLFALGLSGGILATVFNDLAAGMSPDNAVLKPIVYILIFVLGHAINLFMNALGALVHPVRLTFVEFYKNSEFEGGGKRYNPFSLNKS